MTAQEVKEKIRASICSLSSGNLTNSSISLFKTLGYTTDRQDTFSTPSFSEFKTAFIDGNSKAFNEDKALVHNWKYVDFLFQLTDEEISPQNSLFASQGVITRDDGSKTSIESYLFFVIELSESTYTRTALSQITREVNKLFPMPAMLLFKYGDDLTLAIINRRLSKKDSNKDVLEKVTLIKDINIQNPHRAHIEILFDLSFKELQRNHGFSNFIQLHEAWQKTLDTKELNKKFYRELANWYFWALDKVSFPDDVEKNSDIRNATNLIRLITRVIFIWFIKEKNLVPDTLFNKNELKKILKDFCSNGSNTYYRAILQNLFFGTLNQKMNERAFVKEGTFYENKEEYGVKNLFRYSSLFAISKDEVLALFNDIPFMNGGLFDCLDKPDENNKTQYVDGFSRTASRQAQVPDYLFFSDKRDVDLNSTFGTKNKKYEVRGLINVLSRYKFTITENTPIEEEIALDPELLGKVFENLLASYNPETQTTARKQTGSFYTPREIVNYMVDESLKAFLKTRLIEKARMEEQDAKVALDFLFEYNEKDHLFNEEQVEILIHSIDECKILDPACGSGAFPMGVLHKLVHILNKLDQENHHWREVQRKKAIRDSEDAYQIVNMEERQKRLLEINDIFENNASDYGRKLFLIENCIYGVDIQPIAVQIAKLRFFISLVVDQKKQPEKENLGIRALPNLETKFVAANTLIRLEKPKAQTNLFEKEILDSIDALKELRHQYFNAKTRNDKLKFQRKDTDLRKRIAGLLEQEGWKHEIADQIVNFDPYDQNESSPFFDPEWMFGVKDGFHIIIGNPPYVQLQKDSGKLADIFKDCGYLTFERTGDIYTLFYEKGFKILKDKGYLCYITSNKWMRAAYGEELRNFFLSNNPILIIDLGPGIFENAIVDTNIIIIQKANYKDTLRGLNLSGSFSNYDLAGFINSNAVNLKVKKAKPWFIGNDIEQKMKEKIESNGKALGKWEIKINFGIKTGLNEAFIVDKITRERLIAENPKSEDIFKPILRGRNIERYSYKWDDQWLIYIPWHFPLHEDSAIQGASELAEKAFKELYPSVYKYLLNFKDNLLNRNKAETSIRYEWYALQRCAATYYPEFDKEKIVWKRIGSILRFGYDYSGKVCQDSTCIMTGSNLKYLCAVMNSKLGNKLLFDQAPKTGTGDLIVSVQALKPLQIPPITPQNQKVVTKIEQLIDEILMIREKNLNSDIKHIEIQIDYLVYQLYDLTPEEIAIVEGNRSLNS